MISHCAGSASVEEGGTGMLETYTVEVEKTYRQVVKVTDVSRERAMKNALLHAAIPGAADAVLACADVRIVDEEGCAGRVREYGEYDR